jgi:organic radical activating enzyme
MSSDYDEIRFLTDLRSIFVDWDLSSKCNYKCSYCTPASHDGKINFPSIDTFKRVVDKIQQEYADIKDYAVYNLLGGEPTIWNQFEECSRYIKQVNPKNRLQILTNGNRTLGWWQRNIDYINRVILTVHVAQADIKELVSKFNALNTDSYIEFQIALDIAVFDKCVEDFHYAKENLNSNIRVSAKTLLKLLSDPGIMDYTDAQREVIKRITYTPQRTKNKFVKLQDDQVVDDDIDMFGMILQKQNNWKDWACWIGIDTITIRNTGEFKIGSMCNPHLILGNIQDLKFDIPKIPVRCKYSECGCLTDIYTKKVKNYSGPTL